MKEKLTLRWMKFEDRWFLRWCFDGKVNGFEYHWQSQIFKTEREADLALPFVQRDFEKDLKKLGE